MAKLAPLDFIAKWQARFAPNTTFKIEEADFQEFATDIADSFGVTVANVPEYVPGTPYTVGYLVRYTQPGAPEAFYYALNAGVLTAPGTTNTTDWKVVPGPTTATALSQSITLLQAQGLENNGVVAGRTYLIDFGPNANGDAQTVAVRGVGNDCFDVGGTLEINGQRWVVTNVNVQAGTWVLAGTDAYTKAQTDTLLATRQSALTKLERVGISNSSPVATLTSASFNKYTRIDNDGNATVNLPTPTITDLGKVLVLWHYGRAANLTLLVQAKYTNGVKPLDSSFTPVLPTLGYNYVAELVVVLLDRGTPYGDTVPAYAITGLSLLDTSVLATKNYVADALLGAQQLAGYSYNLNLDLNQEQPDYYKKAASITDIVLPAGTGIASLELRLGSGSWSALTLPLAAPIAVPAGTLLTWRVAQYQVGFNAGMANIEVIF